MILENPQSIYPCFPGIVSNRTVAFLIQVHLPAAHIRLDDAVAPVKPQAVLKALWPERIAIAQVLSGEDYQRSLGGFLLL